MAKLDSVILDEVKTRLRSGEWLSAPALSVEYGAPRNLLQTAIGQMKREEGQLFTKRARRADGQRLMEWHIRERPSRNGRRPASSGSRDAARRVADSETVVLPQVGQWVQVTGINLRGSDIVLVVRDRDAQNTWSAVIDGQA